MVLQLRNPLLGPRQHGDTGVAQQPIDLLAHTLLVEPHCVGKASTDRVHAERCGLQNANDAAGERHNPCRVKVVTKQFGDKLVHTLRRDPC